VQGLTGNPAFHVPRRRRAAKAPLDAPAGRCCAPRGSGDVRSKSA
jgi:hypothetical protein